MRDFGSGIRYQLLPWLGTKRRHASLIEKIVEKIHGDGPSSSSDSEDEKPSELKAKIFRLFGRERPVHQIFGGGKCPSLGYLKVSVPEEPLLQFASVLKLEINCAAATLREIASGRDLRKFLAIIAGLWVLSIVGSCCNFLTLFYIVFVLLHAVPPLYEKYKDTVHPVAEKVTIEIKKQYVVFEEKMLQRDPALRFPSPCFLCAFGFSMR
ncbi:hypothetical protein SAY87_031956 [Trapa incisa]|uniref:Reticulon-like protein n=1 Tax=Trapa incisa TaxID=236973 RepID=A0AAN7QLK6_9MYRT|nr:hypothetical protein SAY87_031956 [Trapa incisa]